ncbi:hypothetical protein ANO14919_002830 [Xylariales sp. No.14919]|nr:hypothetical protein ANO14919_002830 [Xylariales sp. No.14919]
MRSGEKELSTHVPSENSLMRKSQGRPLVAMARKSAAAKDSAWLWLGLLLFGRL